MDKRSEDISIIEYARQNSKVIIAQDLDFSMLPGILGFSKPSVISLRLENASPDMVTRRIIETVSEMKRELVEGVVISADEHQIRYRKLPLHENI